jgi:hypothetical protein
MLDLLVINYYNRTKYINAQNPERSHPWGAAREVGISLQGCV